MARWGLFCGGNTTEMGVLKNKQTDSKFKCQKNLMNKFLAVLLGFIAITLASLSKFTNSFRLKFNMSFVFYKIHFI